MPFTASEIATICDAATEIYIGIPQRKMARRQRRMWRKHADELIGVPEASPFWDFEDIDE